MTANLMLKGMFGYNRGELIGKSVDILLPEGLRSQHVQNRETQSSSERTGRESAADILHVAGPRATRRDRDRLNFADYAVQLANSLCASFAVDPAVISVEVDAEPIDLGYTGLCPAP